MLTWAARWLWPSVLGAVSMLAGVTLGFHLGAAPGLRIVLLLTGVFVVAFVRRV